MTRWTPWPWRGSGKHGGDGERGDGQVAPEAQGGRQPTASEEVARDPRGAGARLPGAPATSATSGPPAGAVRGGRADRPGISMVGRADFRSYYDQPILKEPVWTVEIPWYFLLGGIAGASGPLAFAARLAGNHRLARAALTAGSVALAACPPLLISDLGRPERFHYMLRVARPTSPMSVGNWTLAGLGPALFGAAIADRLGITPRLARTAEGVSALLGPVLATYTAVLVANTSVPAWHEAHRELPFVFAGSASASAAAAACLLTPPEHAGPARRLALGGALTELAAVQAMERRLGDLAEPYHHERTGRLATFAKVFTAAGAAVLGLTGHRRPGAVAGSLLLLAGATCERHAVFSAGRLSARDPKYVVEPQRRRLAERDGEPGLAPPESAS
jgi:Polysulphide reductase, NrfD